MRAMHNIYIHLAIILSESAKTGNGFVLAQIDELAKDKAPAQESLRGAGLGSAIFIDLAGKSASDIRHAFIQAVCSGSCVIATGLESASQDALSAALQGLASIHQWNKSAWGCAVSLRRIDSTLTQGAQVVEIGASGAKIICAWSQRPKA